MILIIIGISIGILKKSIKIKEKQMQVEVFLNGVKEPVVYKGDRIDVLDFKMNNIDYKQIRCFVNGFSKSELIEKKLIKRIFDKSE
jgi:hypothetical protein